ncbi:MAG: helix-turn-helix transcriptional regulator [Candidatus Nitrosocaldus sp.]
MIEQDNKGREESIEDLTSKVFKLIVEQGKEGILQSRLWKELNLTSRDGSRIAMRLEKRGLVRRQRVLENGRWTFRLIALRLPLDTTSIEGAPCVTCNLESMCTEDGSVSPNTCRLIENWVLIEMSKRMDDKKDNDNANTTKIEIESV